MTKYTDIGVEKHGHVGLIEIRKPPLNFFDVSLINQIADAMRQLLLPHRADVFYDRGFHHRLLSGLQHARD